MTTGATFFLNTGHGRRSVRGQATPWVLPVKCPQAFLATASLLHRMPQNNVQGELQIQVTASNKGEWI